MISEDLYLRFLDALLKGDRAACTLMVKELLSDNIDVKTLYIDLFQRSLYEVGNLWEQHKVSVTVEHIATAIVEHLLSIVYPVLISNIDNDSYGGGDKKVFMMSCVADEYHKVGARMVADIFELNGWESRYSGGNTPTDDLIPTVDGLKPDCMGLSLSIYSNLPKLMKTLDALRSSFPNLDILVGGQAFVWGDPGGVSKIKNVQYIPDLDRLNSLFEAKYC